MSCGSHRLQDVSGGGNLRPCSRGCKARGTAPEGGRHCGALHRGRAGGRHPYIPLGREDDKGLHNHAGCKPCAGQAYAAASVRKAFQGGAGTDLHRDPARQDQGDSGNQHCRDQRHHRRHHHSNRFWISQDQYIQYTDIHIIPPGGPHFKGILQPEERKSRKNPGRHLLPSLHQAELRKQSNVHQGRDLPHRPVGGYPADGRAGNPGFRGLRLHLFAGEERHKERHRDPCDAGCPQRRQHTYKNRRNDGCLPSPAPAFPDAGGSYPQVSRCDRGDYNRSHIPFHKQPLPAATGDGDGGKEGTSLLPQQIWRLHILHRYLRFFRERRAQGGVLRLKLPGHQSYERDREHQGAA